MEREEAERMAKCRQPFPGDDDTRHTGFRKVIFNLRPVHRAVVRKGYSLFVYDYKYPDLTKKVYNDVCANMGEDIRSSRNSIPSTMTIRCIPTGATRWPNATSTTRRIVLR